MAVFDTNSFLTDYPELTLTDSGRVRCALTGHEMPATQQALEAYTGGAKFLRLRHLQAVVEKRSDVLEDLGDFYVCKITNKKIAKDAGALERHFGGKRYRRLEATAGGDQSTHDNQSEEERSSSVCSEDEGIEEDSGESIDDDLEGAKHPYAGLQSSDAPATDDYDWSVMMDTNCDGDRRPGRKTAKRRAATGDAKVDDAGCDKKKRKS